VVRVWNVEAGKVIDEFQAHADSLLGCGWVAGSQFLVTADQDGRLRSFSREEMGQTRYVHRHSGEVYSAVYTPDNRHAVSASFDGTLRIWDRNDRRESGSLEPFRPTTACGRSGPPTVRSRSGTTTTRPSKET
jgi:WD40 repeat protein